jgi:hypothetical protein
MAFACAVAALWPAVLDFSVSTRGSHEREKWSPSALKSQPSNPRVKPGTANTSGRSRDAMIQNGRRRIWNVLRSLAGGAFLLLMLVVIVLFAVIWLEAGFLSTPGVPV